MSNEKLGAEQGRVTPKGAENVCPVCYHDFADCPCPFEVKPAEQAYHARGAGRVSLTETELEILLAGRFGLGHDLVGNVEILWLTQQLNKLIAAHQGEPGADT